MNNYRAASQLYRAFVFIYRTPLTNTIIYDKFTINKLDISLIYDHNKKTYKTERWRLNENIILKNIKSHQDNKTESPWIEINHFKLENRVIDLIKSEDENSRIIGYEILKLKIEELNLVKK